MRKFSLAIVVFGLLIVGFAYILPVNKYGIDGSLDCNGPLKSMIVLFLGLGFTVLGALTFLLKPFWDFKSNKFFYGVVLVTVLVVVMKIPEIYHETEVNQQCEP